MGATPNTLGRALRTARDLVTSSTRRRGALVVGLAFVERLLAPGLFLAYVHLGTLAAFAVASALTAGAIARGVLQRRNAVKAEAELYRRAVASVLGGDVLSSALLPDDDARNALFEGIHRVGIVLTETIPNLFANVAATVVLAVVLAFLEPARITVLVGGALAVGVLGLYASRGWVDRAQAAAWGAWSRMGDGVTDACEGRLELAASGRSEDFVRQFRGASERWEAQARRAARVAGVSGRVPLLVVAVAVAVGVIVDARVAGLPWETAIVRAGLLASSAPALVGLGLGIQNLVGNGRRLDLLAKICTARDVEGARAKEARASAPERIEWSQVAFAYPGCDEALHDVSFVWRRGETLALAGPNGSGKSTCLRLALGLAELAGGAIRVDGAPLGEIEPGRWRRSVAFLAQRPYLPPRATVAECLRFVDPEHSEEEMLAALERVGVLSALKRLSSSPLRARVGELSVGERQRIALARLLCRDAPLVMLDEPDANLDRDGIHLVAALIQELARSRMVLLVAHTPELLDVADRVVMLESGRVASSVTKPRRATPG